MHPLSSTKELKPYTTFTISIYSSCYVTEHQKKLSHSDVAPPTTHLHLRHRRIYESPIARRFYHHVFCEHAAFPSSPFVSAYSGTIVSSSVSVYVCTTQRCYLQQYYSFDNEEPMIASGTMSELAFRKYNRWQWWFLVALSITFLIVGQSVAVILGRFYYDQGGNSKWISTVVQTAAFPLLCIPLFAIPSPQEASTSASPSIKILALVYFVLGVIIAADNWMYSTGLLYLSASTYSLICASQLAFNAIFSYFINSQKFTALIINSTVVLTLSSALLALNEESDGPSGISKGKYIVGFFCTLGASAIYSLLLSLMQLTFEKVLKKETFFVVLEMQIYTSLVATCASVIGLFASGEWSSLHGEMEGFKKGEFAYVMTLVWTAIAWQVCSVGVVGLIFLVSSLYSNVISTMSLAVTPIAALIVFHDKMNGVKIISMLLALWGFASYIYQNYLDDTQARRAQVIALTSHNDSSC
ncbi:hypothetical protein RJT34_18133 [Clitoria ternatea]|uniref:Probable purine permease n=1 Tax=Clitoria ternatea TaxID=43366 RepID=A0AAN9JCF7_CLITE